MTQVAIGINFLHSKDIVHRDIKPGNAVVKSMPQGKALVKLGDFGLSKFLDQDASSSSLSSDVGTTVFKAPEFFNKDSNGRVSYHRGVDIYAAGVTFTAIMQAIPGFGLRPIVEGSVQPEERHLPIGQAAFERLKNNQPQFNVIEDKESDDVMTGEAKELIRGLTHAHPSKRMSASEMMVSLQAISSVSVKTIYDLIPYWLLITHRSYF